MSVMHENIFFHITVQHNTMLAIESFTEQFGIPARSTPFLLLQKSYYHTVTLIVLNECKRSEMLQIGFLIKQFKCSPKCSPVPILLRELYTPRPFQKCSARILSTPFKKRHTAAVDKDHI